MVSVSLPFSRGGSRYRLAAVPVIIHYKNIDNDDVEEDNIFIKAGLKPLQTRARSPTFCTARTHHQMQQFLQQTISRNVLC